MLCLQVGFVAIRELAVLLRNALAAKTQDAHKEVYCWQVRTGSTVCGERVQEELVLLAFQLVLLMHCARLGYSPGFS